MPTCLNTFTNTHAYTHNHTNIYIHKCTNTHTYTERHYLADGNNKKVLSDNSGSQEEE